MLGTDNIDYYKLDVAFTTLLRASLGDFDYDSVSQANRILGPIYFFGWVMFAVRTAGGGVCSHPPECHPPEHRNRHHL